MKNSIQGLPPTWIALSIGNTHWKWGYVEELDLTRHWITRPPNLLNQTTQPKDWQDYCELSPAFAWHQKCDRPSFPPLCIASVVETAQQPLLNYPKLQTLTLSDIPIAGLYDTLGIDRALAVLGAGHHYGWPCLVIDAGTALTFSGANENCFLGGAIAPGLGLQLRMLSEQTAALPHINNMPSKLPLRWANNTPESILSGIIHSTLDSIVAFQQQWTDQCPNSQVVVTGGDGLQLVNLLQPKISARTP